MARQLTPEEIVTLQVLKDKGQANRAIARTLQVSEAAVRYHLRRQGQPDGRRHKEAKAEVVASAIQDWITTQQASAPDANQPLRPANVKELFDWLQSQHHYPGSYKSVLRFVRAHYPRPRLRPYRRVETPPAAHYGKRSDMLSGTRS